MKNAKWDVAMDLLKGIMSKTQLVETIKWGTPTYTLNNKNIVGLCAFKEYVGMWFHNGIFLKDESAKLFNAQDNVTKALRQWRFYSEDEILTNEKLILQYVDEAIQNEQNGLNWKPEKKQLNLSEFLSQQLSADAAFKDAFYKLTPGRQREYADHLDTAKRDDTKLSRLAKIKPMIFSGIGLNEKYKK
jgi:uncharacterized protein YdeI (YjbR/CyaY-like superfamily)